MAPSRKLRQTYSDALAEAKTETRDMCDRSKRRKFAQVRQNEYHVPMERRSAKYALEQWDGYHFALMCLTMLLRCVLSATPSLRKNHFQDCRLYMGTKRIEQSSLFRGFLDSSEGCKFGVPALQALCKAMCHMHVHFPSAEGDHLHKSTAPILAQQGTVLARVRAVSFFLEFSWVSQYAGEADMHRLRRMSKRDVAAWCWDRQCVPVTPRHGLFDQKPLHRQLIGHAAAGERTSFCKKLEDYYDRRVLSEEECKAVGQCLRKGSHENRISKLVKVLAPKTGYGALAIKNIIEALAAGNLLSDVSQEEWAALPDGCGAKKFWTHTRIDRHEMTQKLQQFWRKLETDDSLKLVFSNGKETRLRFAALGVKVSEVTERLSQYWACCQCRVLSIFQYFLKQASIEIVPYHLWPNKNIRDHIARVWSGNDAEVVDDESSDED